MYIDAKQIGGRIFVAERTEDGTRNIKTHLPPYTFYYSDPQGTHRSIKGDRLNKHRSYKYPEYKRALDAQIGRGCEIFESDVSPVFRLLEERYPGDQGPDLNISFLDIEVDKDPKRGFASVNNPYAAVNAITVYNKWNDEAITIMVPPENLTMEECRKLLDGELFQDAEGNLVTERPDNDDFEPMVESDGYYLVENEAILLELFLDVIEDADVLSGWNSTFFDIPYLMHRIRHVLGGESIAKIAAEKDWESYSPSDESRVWIDRFNLFPCEPSLRPVEHFGTTEKTYQLHGRIHLDYLELYRKFTYEELHSYTLDFILQHEVNQTKVAYEGSLDQLYRWDFRRFTAYNRQDTMGLSDIDDKRKMIALANSMAHMAGVTMDKVMGSVAIIEQAILKTLHKQNLVCFDRVEKEKDLPVPGAYVVNPEKGSYDWVCSYDFNSLYPTVIRIINISPETLIGQFDPGETHDRWFELFAEYDDSARTWGQFTGALEYHRIMGDQEEIERHGITWDPDHHLTLHIEDENESITLPASQWREVLAENGWSVSANGTVFDLSREGIVTQCMEGWYAERAAFKKKAAALFKKADKIEDEEEKAKVLEEAQYYDMVQLVKKIFLNSTYGAYLNRFFRFYDPRLGASVTLSGRVMTKHMIKEVARIMTGNYDEQERRAVIYGDSVAADTRVVTPTGVVAIESLFDYVSDTRDGKEYFVPQYPCKTLTLDADGRAIYKPIKYVMRHRADKKMFRVWLNNSNWIDVTEDHSLMGYVNSNKRRIGEADIQEVRPEDLGDRIKSLIHLKHIPSTRPALEPREGKLMLQFLGYVMGDGSAGKINEGVRLSVGSQDMEEVKAKLLDPLAEAGDITSYHVKANGHDVTVCGTAIFKTVREYLYGNGKKNIPEWLSELDPDDIAAFLRGLFSADGTVVDGGRVVRLTTISEDTARSVQDLLARVGVASSWFAENSENHYEGKPSGTFSKHVVVKSRDDFAETVGFILDRKQSRIKPQHELRKKATAGRDFELHGVYKIEEIEYDGYVYDIEVEDTHTFFANNLLVHNTDSVYATMDWYMGELGMDKTPENAVKLADQIGETLNDGMPEFLAGAFMISEDRGKIVEAGREVVAPRGLFKDKKKRYALHVTDIEGKTTDKMKIMGMETRRSDTPKFIQGFLETCLTNVVRDGAGFEDIRRLVEEFRGDFNDMDPWRRGSPGRVKNLSKARDQFALWQKRISNGEHDAKPPQMHVTVKAAMSTNLLMEANGEQRWDVMRDGDKVEVLYLKPNIDKIDAVAIKTGENYVPEWFKELPFDLARMEEKLIDKKLFNVLGDILGWDFTPPKTYAGELTSTMDDFYG